MTHINKVLRAFINGVPFTRYGTKVAVKRGVVYLSQGGKVLAFYRNALVWRTPKTKTERALVTKLVGADRIARGKAYIYSVSGAATVTLKNWNRGALR